jgi:hypothetical protein
MVETTVTTLKCKHEAKHPFGSPQVGNAALTACPKKKGAIWAYVTDDAGTGVRDVKVTKPSGGQTDPEGFSGFDPLDPKDDYEVAIDFSSVAEKYHPPAMTSVKGVPVRNGEITSVHFKLERIAELDVIVKVADTPGSIEDVQVDLTRKLTGEAMKDKTVKDTGAKFKKLHRGPHTVKITLDEDQQKKYWIDDKDEKPWEVVPGNPDQVVFTVRLIVILKITFRIQEKIAGKFEELIGAKVKVKLPDEEKPTALDDNKALAKFETMIASRNVPSTTNLSLTPDDKDDVYEFIELVTD